MWNFFLRLFDTEGFPARWNCGAAWSEEPGLGWLHILSDLAIFGAYTAIPAVIAFFVLRRRDVPFPRIFWLFVIFIFACGTTHLIGAIIFWQPIYRFDGLIKLVTAIASWSTVAALIVITPEALRLPGLAKLNAELTSEIEERRQTEAALRNIQQELQAKEEHLRQALAERSSLLDSERDARNEAERANRLKDEFLSIVSHELRTPLSAILGYAHLLHDENLPVNEVSDCLSAIERNGRAQVQIIDDLLDMSRIISGKIRLNLQPIQVAEPLASAVDSIRPTAVAKAICIEPKIDATARFILGDNGRLQQVFRNLLSNAIKFSPEGARVEISLQQVKENIEIRFADSGIGIRPDFLPYVFDRFSQAEQTSTRRHGGLGLGLAIVRQIVELHGGAVAAESAGETKGAIFTVTLPVATDAAISDSDAIGPTNGKCFAELPELTGLKVLVVDDEPDTRDVVGRLLARKGASAITASSADEAIAKLKEHRPDIVISDIGMPIKDGYQLIDEIRALPTGHAEIPAVALTAFVHADDRRRAILAGFQSHVAKPVDPGELIAIVAMLANR